MLKINTRSENPKLRYGSNSALKIQNALVKN